MSKSNILTSEEAEQLNHALQSLKSSLDDLMDITNDLIPEKILQLGIPEYFQEFCYTIEVERKISIVFTYEGEFLEMKDDALIKTYRIINSLINILMVQSVSAKSKVHIAYMNNMVKIIAVFSKTLTAVSRKIMKPKIDALHGSMDIQFLEDNTTEFIINFLFNKQERA